MLLVSCVYRDECYSAILPAVFPVRLPKQQKKLEESTMEEEKQHCEWLRARHKTP
jgi:hypothetical protein